MGCPLCGEREISHYLTDKIRSYHQCSQCELVFVESSEHVTVEEERGYYELHENDPTDDGYRKFLSRIASPLLQRLAPCSSGLDFGCGPGPTLSQMLIEKGHRVSLYDLFFYPDKSTLESQYDFVTATEVVEHLARPGSELDRLWSMVKGGGWLALMTKLVIDREAFSRWHYKNDPTHISFFSEPTFRWLANKWSVEPEFIGRDVILFRKPELEGHTDPSQIVID
ncbi:class I SAM-dependent methyltransferase [Porticoccaceae bacterium LTM1]|nr:class I SAM-dependent methyltransferase [Porticoccaceae bacterium LTM1]